MGFCFAVVIAQKKKNKKVVEIYGVLHLLFCVGSTVGTLHFPLQFQGAEPACKCNSNAKMALEATASHQNGVTGGAAVLRNGF